MQMMIESTDKFTTIDGVPCRVWNGTTMNNVECVVFVRRLAVRDDQDPAQFDAELRAMTEPNEMKRLPVFSLRQIL